MKRFFEKILAGATVKFTEFAEFPHLSNRFISPIHQSKSFGKRNVQSC